MGSSESKKEEVIIAQTGQVANGEIQGVTHSEHFGLSVAAAFLVLVILAVLLCTLWACKRAVSSTVRREIVKSRADLTQV